MTLFFFGTLLDPEVLTLVVGREISSSQRKPASLQGYARYTLHNETYPVLRVDPEACTEGIVVTELTENDVARVCFFEDEEFKLAEQAVTLANGDVCTALTFMGTNDALMTTQTWNLVDWQAHHKEHFMPMASEWMAGFQRTATSELEAQWQSGRKKLRQQ